MRIRLLAILVIVSVGLNAGGYSHSVGVTLGTINGLTYKGFVSNNLHFVMQVDAYWQMGLTPEWSAWFIRTEGQWGHYTKYVDITTGNGGDYQSAMIEPSFMYQGKIGRWGLGNMYWFAGGGVGFGAMWGGSFDEVSLLCKGEERFRPWFKMSQHLMMGVEFSFNEAPLVLGIELRPGMAQNYMISGGNLYDNHRSLSGLLFDWGANFSLRYCFGEEKIQVAK